MHVLSYQASHGPTLRCCAPARASLALLTGIASSDHLLTLIYCCDLQKSDKKDAAAALFTAPVVTAVMHVCLRVDTVVTESTVARLMNFVTLPDADAARHAAYALLNATKVALRAQPCGTCGAVVTSEHCVRPHDIAVALIACLASTTPATMSVVPAVGGLIGGSGLNMTDSTTVVLTCRTIRMLLSGYASPMSISNDDSLTAAVARYYFDASGMDDALQSSSAAHQPAVMSIVSSASDMSKALSPVLIQQLSHPDTPCGHPLSAAIAFGEAERLLRFLIGYVENDSRAISLEAMRCLCEVGWDAVLAAPSGLETVLSRLMVRLLCPHYACLCACVVSVCLLYVSGASAIDGVSTS